MSNIKRVKIKSCKNVGSYDNEYVYDIGMADEENPWFFGNNILLHNSCYFTAFPALKEEIYNGTLTWDKEIAIQTYDTIASEVCKTFPEFAKNTFNIPYQYGDVLRSSREMVCTKGLFIKRKRYSVMVFDKEGKRKDVNGPGELKVTGLEIKRSDTPKVVQAFLQRVLEGLMDHGDKNIIIEEIKKFKEEFSQMKPWLKGTPKAVNGMKYYGDIIDKQLDKRKVDGKRVTVPGHVRASMYWNMLREINKDNNSMKILEGSKIVVCKLKQTPDNIMDSIAYPIDEIHLPEWFKELPFDDDEMMQVSVNKKLDNILGVLKWDLSMTNENADVLHDLFDFSAIDC